jgi:hypothetical protein
MRLLYNCHAASTLPSRDHLMMLHGVYCIISSLRIDVRIVVEQHPHHLLVTTLRCGLECIPIGSHLVTLELLAWRIKMLDILVFVSGVVLLRYVVCISST